MILGIAIGIPIGFLFGYFTKHDMLQVQLQSKQEMLDSVIIQYNKIYQENLVRDAEEKLREAT